MRLIGYVAEESAARTFSDFLLAEGIESQIEREQEGWGVWIADEDKVERAVGCLARFRQNPADPAYQKAARTAEQIRDDEQQGELQYQRRLKNRRHLFRPLTSYGFGPLTFVLIFISVIVFVLSKYGADWDRVMALMITDYSGGVVGKNLPEIWHGQVWRLITPIFVHGNIVHILFNMLWLRDLGSMIEGRQSSWMLAGLVLAVAAGSNLMQFYVGTPAFGGMSGVVYGLFGYIWIRGKFDPGSGLYLHSSTVVMMIAWFFICVARIIPNVANTAHAVGLVMGMLWGYLSSLRYR